MLVVVALAGLNDAVTPVGSPDVARLTALLKPFCPVMPMVLVALAPPSTRLTLPCEDVRVKLGTGMVTTIGTELVKVPDVPATVTVNVPGVAVLLDDRVRVLVLVVLAGLNEAVTPPGSPDAAKFTLLEKPLCPVIVIVLVALLPPSTRVRLLCEDPSLNPGACMVSAMVVEFV